MQLEVRKSKHIPRSFEVNSLPTSQELEEFSL